MFLPVQVYLKLNCITIMMSHVSSLQLILEGRQHSGMFSVYLFHSSNDFFRVDTVNKQINTK